MSADLIELTDDEQLLYDDLLAESESEAVRTLAAEAIRVWRRLCELDRVLSGDRETWLTITDGHDGVLAPTADAEIQELKLEVKAP